MWPNQSAVISNKKKRFPDILVIYQETNCTLNKLYEFDKIKLLDK